MRRPRRALPAEMRVDRCHDSSTSCCSGVRVLLAGLVTYLLLLLYFQQRYGERPSLRRLRQLRRQIRREATIAYLPAQTTAIDPSLWLLILVLCCKSQANL